MGSDYDTATFSSAAWHKYGDNIKREVAGFGLMVVIVIRKHTATFGKAIRYEIIQKETTGANVAIANDDREVANASVLKSTPW